MSTQYKNFATKFSTHTRRHCHVAFPVSFSFWVALALSVLALLALALALHAVHVLEPPVSWEVVEVVGKVKRVVDLW